MSSVEDFESKLKAMKKRGSEQNSSDMTIKMFVDECNSVIEKSNIKPSIEATCIRYDGVRILREYFMKRNIEIKSLTYSDSDICITKKKNITLQSGEAVELNVEVSFKTATKRTGNIIPISKTQSKYELIASDKFIKFNKVRVCYNLHSYELDKNNKPVKTRFVSLHEAVLLQDPKITWSIDDIINNIDVEEIEKNYAQELAQPLKFHKLLLSLHGEG